MAEDYLGGRLLEALGGGAKIKKAIKTLGLQEEVLCQVLEEDGERLAKGFRYFEVSYCELPKTHPVSGN